MGGRVTDSPQRRKGGQMRKGEDRIRELQEILSKLVGLSEKALRN